MKTIGLLCLLAFSAAAQDASQLVGRWRSVETSKGGIGAMYDFGADGTVQFSPGAIVEQKYHLDGDRLSFDTDGTIYSLVWNGTDHVGFSVKGQSENYARLGLQRDPQNPLLGEWTGPRDMGGQKVLVHWIFSDDGRALLMVRFLTQAGTYSIQSGRLMAMFGGQVGLDGPIRFADGVLAIHRSRGRVTRLARY
jgi:hypothetical protein